MTDGSDPTITVHWHVAEVRLRSDRDYELPLHDVSPVMRLRSPSGLERALPGFWDGGRTWRFRARADELGLWQWRTEESNHADAGLDGHQGSFRVLPYKGDNPLYRHGAVRPSPSGLHFAHADGTPFFWLGDTAWNGVPRAQEAEWNRYLRLRCAQGFNVVAFFSTHWRGWPRDADGRAAYEPGPPLSVDPAVFRRLDARVRAVNERGLLAAPILLVALFDQDDGIAMRDSEAIRLARYIVARWGAYHVAWSLGGDGDFSGERAARWRRIGRAVLGHEHLATMHPRGLSWDADEFRDEPWFSFIGYQSGHFAAPDAVAWITRGPLRQEWLRPPPRPIVNLEPNYEEHPALDTGYVFTERDVRRAVYWSLLLVPPAGVTYGNFHVWSWSPAPEGRGDTLRGLSAAWPPLGPWSRHLETPGVTAMTLLRSLFESGPWTALRPADEILDEQPGEATPVDWIAVASTPDRRWTVAYLPRGGVVSLRLPDGQKQRAQWFDPRTGDRRSAAPEGWRGDPTVVTFRAPDEQDWVLTLGPRPSDDPSGVRLP